MNTDTLSLIDKLSNQQLVSQIKLLATRERESTAALIAHLVVLDERGLYRGEGCSSLFTYCLEVLHLSEHAAYGRIEAVRAVRKFPILLKLLSGGSVNLTTVTLLAPHLTEENHLSVLQAATHQRKRRVEEIVAELRPLPVAPACVRKLPTPKRISASVAAPDAAMGDSDNEAPALTLTMPPRSAVIAPLAPERYKVQFTASAETYAKLQMAQELLRHEIQGGDVGEIIDRALTVLLKNLTKQKFAATDHPRRCREQCTLADQTASGGEARAEVRSRHIPAEVRRTVWMRDNGRCVFITTDGRRCTERSFLEFHHVIPHGAGGEATVDNIQLRCRVHNEYEAELHFGRDLYVARREDRRRRAAGSPAGTIPTRSGPSSRSRPAATPHGPPP